MRARLRRVGMSGRSEQGPDLQAVSLPAVEQVVNLTAHPVTVETLTVAPAHGESAPVQVTFAPGGPLARVQDKRAGVGEHPVGLLRATRFLRRGSLLEGPRFRVVRTKLSR